MNWKNEKNKRLVEAILALDTSSEAESFLRDLLTESEIKEFANRLQAARMLMENVPYTKIEEETGLSSTTVARVSKWLNRGKGGYQSVINKLQHHHNPVQTRGGLS